jgi:N-acyl-D-aspartate/D-glutamate deacylase
LPGPVAMVVPKTNDKQVRKCILFGYYVTFRKEKTKTRQNLLLADGSRPQQMKNVPFIALVRRFLFRLLSGAYLILLSSISSFCQSPFDLVIKGGVVIDPETKLNEVRNIGIVNGRITEISERDLTGAEVLDAKGLVVAPGFIDLHVHGITNQEQEFQARDGVTTALELESGIEFLQEWHNLRQGNALINYGGSASWRMAHTVSHLKYEHHQLGLKSTLNQEGWDRKKILSVINYEVPSEIVAQDEIDSMLRYLRMALEEGAIGIGLPLGYNPLANRGEIFRIFQFASAYIAPIFIHVRDFGLVNIQQAIADAAVTGAPLHIVHVHSMALRETGLAIEMVSDAQKKGLDITTELYPYTAASTFLQSALFDEGWQEKMGITYSDIQWVATGERLTESTFKKYRKMGGIIVNHLMKPEWIAAGIKSPITMIASDGMPYAPFAHPRTAGTFSRVLGKYVREDKLLSLPEAIKKMTLMPANRLQDISPMMRLKGRIQVGCDADITIFDPNTVMDKATYEKGLAFSHGIEHVLVNGVFIVRNAQTVPNTFPGKPVFGRYKK